MAENGSARTERIAWLTDELREAETNGDHKQAHELLYQLQLLHLKRIQGQA